MQGTPVARALRERLINDLLFIAQKKAREGGDLEQNAELDQYCELCPDCPEGPKLKAQLFVARGEFQKALDMLERARNAGLDPKIYSRMRRSLVRSSSRAGSVLDGLQDCRHGIADSLRYLVSPVFTIHSERPLRFSNSFGVVLVVLFLAGLILASEESEHQEFSSSLVPFSEVCLVFMGLFFALIFFVFQADKKQQL